MLYKKLDFFEKKLSHIALGTDYFGKEIPENDCFDILDEYFNLGGNVIDTARLYSKGKSEEVIGKWIKLRKNADDVTVITKCAHHEGTGKSRLSYDDIESDIDKSLLLLGTEKIDLLFLHRDDENIAPSEIIETLNEMVKKGKIKHFGASNWRLERIKQANRYAKEKNLIGFLTSEIKWSYAKNSPLYKEDPELVIMNDSEKAFYEAENLPVFAYASQAKGFFAKLDTGGVNALSEKAKERYLCEENLIRYKKLKKLSYELGVSINAVNLAYLTSQKKITAIPVIGSKNICQLKENLSSPDLVLTDDMIKFLEN